jgi:outer membrane protein assembly factor BamB
MNMSRRLTIALALLLPTSAFATDAWTGFRGGSLGGVSQEKKLPDKWSASDNVAWVADIPGRGWSSPVVLGDRVFLTTALSPGAFKQPSPGIYGNDYIAELRAQGLPNEEISRRVRARDNEVPDESGDITWLVLALDAKSGRELWRAEVHRGKPFGGRHRKNTYASVTLATDGARLYVYLGNVGVFAYSLDGRPLWSWRVEPGRTYNDFGTSSSPIVHEGRVYVIHDNQEECFLAALDATSGREVWRTRRDFGDAFVRTSFATPFVWKNRRRTELVTVGPRVVISYDFDGRELWRFSGMSMVAAPTPVATPELLVVGSGSPSENVRPLVAFRPGAKGDVSLKPGEEKNDVVAWRHERGGSYITSPLVHGGRVYVLYDKGFFAAFDLESGRELYKVRFPEGSIPTFSSSPWAHGPQVFCLSEQGETFVLEAGDAFRVRRTNVIDEMSLATPALAHGSLFLRTATKLYRIGG